MQDSWLFGQSLRKNRSKALPTVDYPFNNALVVNTSQYGVVQNITGTPFPSQLTISCWMKSVSAPATSVTKGLFGSTGGGANFWLIRFVGSTATSGYAKIEAMSSVINSGSPHGTYTNATLLNRTHFVFTVKDLGSGVKSYQMYFNGVPGVEYQSSTAPISTFGTVELFRDFLQSNSGLPGTYAEFDFMNVPVTAADVKLLYNKGRGGYLVNHDNIARSFRYKFDESSGTSVADSSGNNRPLSLVGSPSFVPF
jgi:hypothetical protein